MLNVINYGDLVFYEDSFKMNENRFNEQWDLSEIKLLNWLQSIINQMDLNREFSLGETLEQCVCLNKKEDKWEVYLVEKGNIFDKSEHEELFDACIKVILQLSDSKEFFEQHKARFCRIRNK